MALSAFGDKSQRPGPDDLVKTLRRAGVHWNDLLDHLAAEYAPLEQVWGFSGDKWGWSLRLKHGKRTILYMTPREGHFLVGFALGEKAVQAARQSRLSATVLRIIDEAPKYAEGRGVRLEVRNKSVREQVKKLATIKMAN